MQRGPISCRLQGLVQLAHGRLPSTCPLDQPGSAHRFRPHLHFGLVTQAGPQWGLLRRDLGNNRFDVAPGRQVHRHFPFRPLEHPQKSGPPIIREVRKRKVAQGFAGHKFPVIILARLQQTLQFRRVARPAVGQGRTVGTAGPAEPNGNRDKQQAERSLDRAPESGPPQGVAASGSGRERHDEQKPAQSRAVPRHINQPVREHRPDGAGCGPSEKSSVLPARSPAARQIPDDEKQQDDQGRPTRLRCDHQPVTLRMHH